MFEIHCRDNHCESLCFHLTFTTPTLVDSPHLLACALVFIAGLWPLDLGISLTLFLLFWTLCEVFSFASPTSAIFWGQGLHSTSALQNVFWGRAYRWILGWIPTWEVWTSQLFIDYDLSGHLAAPKMSTSSLYCSCSCVATLHLCWEQASWQWHLWPMAQPFLQPWKTQKFALFKEGIIGGRTECQALC